MEDQVPPQPLGLDSFLDEGGPVRVSGWVWAPERPEETVTVELVDAFGDVAISADASQFRADLETAGKRGGRCAFLIEAPANMASPFAIRARFPSGDPDGIVLAQGLNGPAADAEPTSRSLSGPGGTVGYLDRADAGAISGWCYAGEAFAEPVTLELTEADQVLACVRAERWRNDIEDVRQGNGRCGFGIEPPAHLYDGREHRLDLRLPGGPSLLKQPLAIQFPQAVAVETHAAPTAAPVPVRDATVALSVVVNFFNMEREAARTLHSLSRRFQQGVERIAYEVLCIDNGSNPPMSEAFVAGFGPEFRLVRTSVQPSPCIALNEAAAQARGRWLGLMIDGAHIVSAGALREAHTALCANPQAIVALRQWFIGGDQRWLSSVGYSREQEDLLFARIAWPENPYKLFDISSPMYESPNSWFDGMSESNCLFIPAELHRRIGGFDERFDMAGAGFANLDLFRRATEGADAVISLVGEASFHQYHGGMTTNIDEGEKDRRVRTYASHYEQVRGEGFTNLPFTKVRVSGAIRTSTALIARQRPYGAVKLGLTDRVRPRVAAVQFDEEAQRYLQSAYVETGRHRETRWAGEAVGVAPTDLTDIQDAVWRVRPEHVVIKGAAPGLVRFVAAILPALGLEGTQVLWVSDEACDAPAGVTRMACGAEETAALRQVERSVGDAERVLVLFQPDPEGGLPVDALTAWSRLVSFESYLIVLGVALGQPWLGYSRSWTYRAIVRFVAQNRGFVIDRSLNRHFVTTCPSGFLRRVLDPVVVGDYDPMLDDLSGL